MILKISIASTVWAVCGGGYILVSSLSHSLVSCYLWFKFLLYGSVRMSDRCTPISYIGKLEGAVYVRVHM